MSPFTMTIKGPLFLLTKYAWDAALCHLDADYYLARFTVSPGFVLGRPAWPDGESRRKWLNATHAIEVDRADLSDEMQARMGQFELLTAQ